MTKEARRYVLETLCEPLRRDGWPKPVNEGSLMGRSTEHPGVEEGYVEYQITSLENSGYVHRIDDHTLCIHPSGIDEYEALTGTEIEPDGLLTEVLTVLDERDPAETPGVARTDLLQETGLRERQLDRTVWFLDERGDVTTVSGRDKPFLTARLTDEGRQRIE